ncbi:unnamed protein product [Linum tenue]|uniref:Phospholipase A1 n=1 Tax=Linum tenue TaxID=586396 RepID=A0AAV0IS92_9ROSI|nr:unnamed protein product [Linum tenue]
MGSIAANWKKLSGEDEWAGLLEPPLDADLRRYLIHYAERAQALYDAFNDDKLSTAYGFSRYPPDEDFFASVFLRNGNPYEYEITHFFYASTAYTVGDWAVADGRSAWIGYVAVSTEKGTWRLGRRDILVCWRGTKTRAEWFQDASSAMVPASEVFGSTAHDPMVHQGFFSVYTHNSPDSTYNKTSARQQVLAEVRRLVDKYRDEETSITVVGHSLGAALATLNAADIVTNGPTTSGGCMVTAFVYGCPLTGDQGFHDMFTGLSHHLRLLRIRNFPDPVTTYPPEFFGFVHVGKELVIYIKSPYIKPGPNHHSLELYMHGLDGYNGVRPFELVVRRDLALVNKGEDHLKDEFKVPLNWWTEKNKAMRQLGDGSWAMADYMPPPPAAAEDDGES